MAEHLSSRRRVGFTIVELLVVAGIMAILAAIIMVVFSSARRAAKKTACMSNLSQIGKALHLYALDSDGFAPPYATRSVSAGGVGVIDGDAQLWRDSLLRYAGSEDVFYCPADQHAKSSFREACIEPGDSVFTSYETTPVVNGEVSSDKRVIVSVDNPKFQNVSYLQDRVCQGRDATGKYGYRTYHDAMMSVLFLDGHVKHITITDEKE